jgi:hypothetical protein
MKSWLVIALCCCAFLGCKKKAETPVHQHSAECSHVRPPISQDTSSKSKPMSELNEEQLQRFIQMAERGDTVRSYMLYRYYEQKQDQVNADYWLAKTRQLAENASPDNTMVAKIRTQLGSKDNESAILKTVAPQSTTDPTLPAKRIAPRIKPQ